MGKLTLRALGNLRGAGHFRISADNAEDDRVSRATVLTRGYGVKPNESFPALIAENPRGEFAVSK